MGDFENSGSPYGTFDQGGNVFEWNESMPALPASSRGILGGSFQSGLAQMNANSAGSAHPTSEEDGIGFRVAAVPEPAMLAVLALGGMVVVGRRRR